MDVKKLSRTLKRPRRSGEIATARGAIRNHCIECMGYQTAEVQKCTTPECWLFPYRMGRRVKPDLRWPKADGKATATTPFSNSHGHKLPA